MTLIRSRGSETFWGVLAWVPLIQSTVDGAVLDVGLRCGPLRSDIKKASTSDGSWKESWWPLGALSRRIAGKARVNFICCWCSSVHIC